MIYDVFISYSRSDMVKADKICKAIQEAGLSCFVDRTCIPPGVDYEIYLRHAIRKSKIFLFISSKHSWKSVWGMKEIREFLDECNIERLFIIKIDNYPIPVSEYPYIDGVANITYIDEDFGESLGYELMDICKDIDIDDDGFNDIFPNVPMRTFISHSHADNQIADMLYSYLRGEGIDCWIDIHDIPPGVPYAKAISEGINTSQCFVVLFSRNVISSEDILNEIDIAHRKGLKIIPFLLDRTTMTDEYMYYLSRKQWIDGYPNPEEKFESLIHALK